MTVFELESALVEFTAQNTSELRFRSNETTEEETCPQVYSGFIPRDEVGSIIPGDITVYPAIIINAHAGAQASKSEGEIVTVNFVIGCFDALLDQQGYRDCCNLLQRLRDRFREVDIIRERFPVRYPIHWQINKVQRAGGGSNAYPYFFAEMQIDFEVPMMMTQYDVDIGTGDDTEGRFNTYLEEPYIDHR